MFLSFLILPAAYFIFALIYFLLVQKPLFFMLNKGCNKQKVSAADVFQVYRHGIKSDFIIASYLSFIPLILSTLRQIGGHVINLDLLLLIYNSIIAVAVTLITCADAVLYRYWQYKLEASVFQYLRHPKGAFASVSTGYLIGAILGVLIFCSVWWFPAEWLCRALTPLFPYSFPGWWQTILIFILFLVAGTGLFIITRGLKIRPNNPSIVYFSATPFFNHWALNPAYNLIYSLTTMEKFDDQFRNFPPRECAEIVSPLFPSSGVPARKLLKTDRPNILMIVWESFGAEFVGTLGGRPGITPNIDRIADEGVIFTRCTAGSFRTDRGLVCILSGYLGQPTTSVMRYTRKLPNLPALPRRLRDLGYTTTAVHGGELAIMHKADYYLASGHSRLVSQTDLPADAPAGKWGIEDGWMLRWLYDDILDKTRRGEKWYTTFQTLSSHEPFKVPYRRLENDVDNSFAYVDAEIGRFVDDLRKTPAWDDLLIVIVADHGYNISHHPVNRAAYAHIPVILAGGAVAAHERIDTIMSQTDIAATLLGQLRLPHKEFTFSRDILSPDYRFPFAFHTYNNGFLIIDGEGATQFDNVAGKAVSGDDPRRIRIGKAILQNLYDDLAKR